VNPKQMRAKIFSVAKDARTPSYPTRISNFSLLRMLQHWWRFLQAAGDIVLGRIRRLSRLAHVVSSEHMTIPAPIRSAPCRTPISKLIHVVASIGTCGGLWFRGPSTSVKCHQMISERSQFLPSVSLTIFTLTPRVWTWTRPTMGHGRPFRIIVSLLHICATHIGQHSNSGGQRGTQVLFFLL